MNRFRRVMSICLLYGKILREGRFESALAGEDGKILYETVFAQEGAVSKLICLTPRVLFTASCGNNLLLVNTILFNHQNTNV